MALGFLTWLYLTLHEAIGVLGVADTQAVWVKPAPSYMRWTRALVVCHSRRGGMTYVPVRRVHLVADLHDWQLDV